MKLGASRSLGWRHWPVSASLPSEPGSGPAGATQLPDDVGAPSLPSPPRQRRRLSYAPAAVRAVVSLRSKVNQSGNHILLCPEQKKTSPKTMSVSVLLLLPPPAQLAQSARAAYEPPPGRASSSTFQVPSAAAVAL